MKHSEISQNKNKMSIIRIAPVCNGKIYVVPRVIEKGETPQLDLPIVENVEHMSANPEKAARKVKEKFHQHLCTEAMPRFCVMHRPKATKESTIHLYVLPLQGEDEVHFHGGEWVKEEDISNRPEAYTPDLQTEGALLGMAAELWAEFHTTGE